jgi:hypothetical protein
VKVAILFGTMCVIVELPDDDDEKKYFGDE